MKMTIMKRILLFFLCLIPVTGAFLYAQTDMLHERLYLSTDKECYLAGEPLWISAFSYYTPTGEPSEISALAYIEIQDLSASHIQTKMALKEGRGSAVVALPLTLPTGIYRLTGYTRYMQSESISNVYTKYITVYNPLSPLRTENVTTVSAVEQESACWEFQDEGQGSFFQITADGDRFGTKKEVKLSLSNLLDDEVTASVSVFKKETLNGYKNPSIATVVNKSLQEKISPFNMRRIDYAGEVIHGHIVDENNVLVTNVEGFGTYLSIAGSDIQYFTGEIRDNGKVRFFTSNLHGDGTLISYVPSQEENAYHLVLDSIYLNPVVSELPTLVLDAKQEDILKERNMGVRMYHAFRLDTLDVETPYENNLQFEKSGIVYKLDEYTRFPTMAEVMIEFIQEARFRTVQGERKLQVRLRDVQGVSYDFEDPTPALILLDGIPVPDHSKIYNYSPSLIKEIIIYPAKYAFGLIYYNGIVFIKTYRGDYPELELEESMRIQDFQGVQNPRTLGVLPADSRLPDLRHTLYWNPKLDVKANDSASITFKTAETTGEFVVVAEGMSKTGKPFRSEHTFHVTP